MKTVLLVGGFGGLGYYVAEKFYEDGWKILVLDKPSISNWESNIEEELPLNVPVTRIVAMPQPRNVDLVVYLAEQNDPNTYYGLLDTNILLTDNICKYITHMKEARLVVVGWSEAFLDSDIFGKAINDRMKYPKFYNIGNNIISFIRLPRLLSPYQHHLTFGNVVKRIYKALSQGNYPMGHAREMSRHSVEWINTKAAANCIFAQAIRRTREDVKVYGTAIQPIDIARFVSDMLNAPHELEFRTGKKTYNINNGKYKTVYMPKQFVELIEECINVWNRQPRNDDSSL